MMLNPFTIDPARFVDLYQAKFGRLTSDANQGLQRLIHSLGDDTAFREPAAAAYVLATVKHECAGRFQPIEEFGKGRGKPYGRPVRVPGSTAGVEFQNIYYGRGFVQLTWERNYRRMDRALALGNQLWQRPQLALDHEIAYRIMSEGMRQGLFTGKAIGEFVGNGRADFVNARRVINGLDKAERIAEYAHTLLQLIESCTAPAELKSAA